ncbi:MAG: nucleotidyltransferase domain-containing protein [Sandaracinaceae bacterium]|nr:nucleotidyltransferase domain-containing protein [Sandaracinaceae bacterium]
MKLRLEDHTIFVTLAGSQAHGTAREGSDVDLRGVAVAPLATRLSLFGGFEQHEGPLPEALERRVRGRLTAHPTASRGLGVKTECVVYDVAKLAALAATANPNALEILFADERDWVLETPAWRRLHAERRVFLTKQVAQTFLGYAMAQLRRIRTHRGWLLTPPAMRPSREDFGLPADRGALSRDDLSRVEQSVAARLKEYGTDDLEMPKAARLAVRERMIAFQRDALSAEDADDEELEARVRAVATDAAGLPAEVVATLSAERRYRAARKRWDAYEAWRRGRNPARAELERRFGYDTKHAMHLVRLMRMGIEALERGELRVRREDAEELAAIRDGALSFDALLEEAERLRERMARATEATALPDRVDEARVDALVLSLTTAGALLR